MISRIAAQDSPELNKLLDELQESMDLVNNKLKPVITKLESGEMETKHGMSYLEMKYNLMLTYCNLLSFYILMKLEGK